MGTSTLHHDHLIDQLPHLPWLRDHDGGLMAEAGRVWRALLSESPDPETWEDYLWLVGYKDPYLMVEIAKRILKIKPERHNIWRALSVSASMIGDAKLACLAAYRCSRSGGEASDWIRLGTLAWQQGRKKRAAQACNEALRLSQLHPLAPDEQIDLGKLLRNLGDTAKASELFSRAILSDGAIADAWDGLAEIKVSEGKTAYAETLRIQGRIAHQLAWERSPLGALFCSDSVDFQKMRKSACIRKSRR